MDLPHESLSQPKLSLLSDHGLSGPGFSGKHFYLLHTFRGIDFSHRRLDSRDLAAGSHEKDRVSSSRYEIVPRLSGSNPLLLGASRSGCVCAS
jgi:hypothetical protein